MVLEGIEKKHKMEFELGRKRVPLISSPVCPLVAYANERKRDLFSQFFVELCFLSIKVFCEDASCNEIQR